MQFHRSNRNYTLDFVKIIATVFILFHHFQQISGAWYSNHPNFFGNKIMDWSWMVELFFAISGFFAYSSSCENTSFSSYLGKKLKRLLPVIACSMIIYCLLNYLHVLKNHRPWFFSDLPNLWGLVVSCLGLQTGLGLKGYSLNNPMWFVSILIQCYCLYYVTVVLSRKKQNLVWILFILVFVILDLRSREIVLPFFSHEAKRGFLPFLIGGLVALFVKHYDVNRPIQIICLCCILLFVGFLNFAPAYIDAENWFIFLFCPALIILAQSHTSERFFHHKVWQHLSEISFNVYVWHSPLQLFLALTIPQIIYSEQLTHMYLYAAAAWLVGTVSYFLIEGPLRKLVSDTLSRIIVKKTTEAE